MKGRETLLFYLFSVVSLVVVSILTTNQIERVEIQPLPTHTPVIAITPQPTALPPQTSRLYCARLSRTGVTFGYLPDTATLTNLPGNTLTVSGTVYAEDFVTPLPEVLIEVWRATPESDDDFPPFILLQQVRTDAAGRYAFTIPKPDPIINYQLKRFLPIYFHYLLSYQGNCPHFVQLFYANTAYGPSGTPRSRKLPIKQVRPGNTILQGPVDLALSHSPPTP